MSRNNKAIIGGVLGGVAMAALGGAVAAYMIYNQNQNQIPLIISPAIKEDVELIMFSRFHSVPYASLSDIDFVKLSADVKNPESGHYWPKSEAVLNNICVDYGRSHYILVEDEDFPYLIHRYGFRNVPNPPSIEESKEFFKKLQIPETIVPDIFSNSTPNRSEVLAKVKYSLLVNYLREKQVDQPEVRALAAMAATCQFTLSYIKFQIYDHFESHGRQKPHFCSFKISVTVVNKNPILTVCLSNDIPKTGTWQIVSKPNVDKNGVIKAIFTINLSDQNDRGIINIVQEGNNWNNKRNIYGIYNADKDTLIKYEDTLPTW